MMILVIVKAQQGSVRLPVTQKSRCDAGCSEFERKISLGNKQIYVSTAFPEISVSLRCSSSAA